MIFFNWNPIIHKILVVLNWLSEHGFWPIMIGFLVGFILGWKL